MTSTPQGAAAPASVDRCGVDIRQTEAGPCCLAPGHVGEHRHDGLRLLALERRDHEITRSSYQLRELHAREHVSAIEAELVELRRQWHANGVLGVGPHAAMQDAFRQVAAALFPEDVDHLMTNTPLGDAVDALVGRVKQLRLADQASADASMVIAERSKEIARALDVSESTTWKELVAQVVNRARLAQRLADGESARDALAVALGCEGTTWAELLSIAKGDDRGEANVQSKPCQRCDAGTLFKTLGTRGYPIWECSSCAHQENVAVGRAKPPGSRRPELEPGPTTISGSVGPYVDPELASLRAELAALGKHLEDVERRAYMSPTGEALAALEGRHMARIDDLTKRVEALVKRVEVSPPVWEVLSTRVAKIEGALDGWGPNEMLTSLAELRRGDWVVFDGAPREVVGLSPSEVVLGRGSADVYIDRTGPALQLVWRPGPRE